MAKSVRDAETWGLIWITAFCLAYTLLSVLAAIDAPFSASVLGPVFPVLSLWVAERGLWYRKLYVTDSQKIITIFIAETHEIKARVMQLEKQNAEMLELLRGLYAKQS